MFGLGLRVPGLLSLPAARVAGPAGLWQGQGGQGTGTAAEGLASTCTYSEAHRAQRILQCKVEPCARCGNLWVHFSAWVSSKHPRCHPEQRTSAGGRGKPLSGSELFGASSCLQPFPPSLPEENRDSCSGSPAQSQSQSPRGHTPAVLQHPDLSLGINCLIA